MMNLWAVIPSKNRMKTLVPLVEQLLADNVKVVIIDNGYEQEELRQLPASASLYMQWMHEDPPNISKLWNAGLDWVAEMNAPLGAENEYFVAVLNDDIIVPPEFVQRLAVFMETQDAAAAYPDQHDYFIGQPGCLKHTTAETLSMFTRLCGYAFALRGSLNLRADETLKWWYGDDDLFWRANLQGGSVLVGGLKVEHLSPNSTTVGKLAEQAGLDRQTFIDKWGRAPW